MSTKLDREFYSNGKFGVKPNKNEIEENARDVIAFQLAKKGFLKDYLGISTVPSMARSRITPLCVINDHIDFIPEPPGYSEEKPEENSDEQEEYIEKIVKAKKICQQCPLQKHCLVEAVLNEDQIGVLGGTDPAHRKTISNRAVSIRRKESSNSKLNGFKKQELEKYAERFRNIFMYEKLPMQKNKRNSY